MLYRNINPLIATSPPPKKKRKKRKRVSFEFNLVENGICGVGAEGFKETQ